MSEQKSLAQRLEEFANRHRMMMGIHPDNALVFEAVAALQSHEADALAYADPYPTPNPTPVAKKGRKS